MSFKKKGAVIIDSHCFANISNKQYTIHHTSIQKCKSRFDNRFVTIYGFDEDAGPATDAGIDKRRYKAQDDYSFDEYKDANLQYLY